MSTTNVTLRINSYQTKNKILAEGSVFTGTSKAKNCENTSILTCLDDFFEAAHAEVNDKYNIVVHGNIFEQAFVRAEAERRADVIECATQFNKINWTSQERLQYLANVLGPSAQKITIPVSLNGNHHLELPDYSLVSFTFASATHKLVVSNDLFEIKDYFDEGNCESVAFLVGGQSSRENDNNFIIGCTEENVNELVCAYLETRYINPFIGKTCAEYCSQYNPQEAQLFFLADKIDTYFYSDYPHKRFELFEDEEITLGIHSVSMDAEGQLKLDDQTDLLMLHIVEHDTELTKEIIVVSQSDIRKMRTAATGQCAFTYYTENDVKLLSVDIVVRPHVYIQKLSSEILENGQPVVQWQLGRTYNIVTQFSPANAEDKNSITVTTDHPEIARVEGKKITILQEGWFNLITTSREARDEHPYIIHDAVVRAVHIQRWPEKNELAAGSTFETRAYAEPATQNLKGCSYEVLKGEKCIEISMDAQGENVKIKALKPGTCAIRFTSNDNPDISRTKNLKVLLGPKKSWLFIIIGLVLSFLSLFSIGATDYYWGPVFLGIAAILFLLACFRREKFAIPILIAFTVICSIVGIFFLSSDRSEEGSHPKVSAESIAEIRQEAERLSLNTSYIQDPYYGKTVWTPTTAEYLGYFVNKTTLSYELFAACRVELVNPDAEAPLTTYTTVAFKEKGLANGDFKDYELDSQAPDWHNSLGDWLNSYTNNDNICETSFTEEELLELFGWNRFLRSANDIRPEDASLLVDMCIEEGDLEPSEITAEHIYLFVEENPYAETRNRLYIYLQKDEPNTETGDVRSYCFRFFVENLEIATDETGNTVVVMDDIDIEEDGYFLITKDNPLSGPSGSVLVEFANQ